MFVLMPRYALASWPSRNIETTHTHTCVSRVIAAWTENMPLYSTSSNFPNKQTQNISSADNKHRHECFFGVCARLIHISGSHAVKIEFRVCDMVESPPPPPTRLVWIERTRWVMHALTHAMCVGVNEPGSRAASQGCWDNIEYIRNFECGSVCGFWANVNCSEQFLSPIGWEAIKLWPPLMKRLDLVQYRVCVCATNATSTRRCQCSHYSAAIMPQDQGRWQSTPWKGYKSGHAQPNADSKVVLIRVEQNSKPAFISRSELERNEANADVFVNLNTK